MTIIEFRREQFSLISPLLGEYKEHPVVNAVIEGNASGRIFGDYPTNPGSAFVLTNAGFSYLAGSPQNDNFNRGLKELLENDLFPEIRESDDPTLIFYPLTEGWGQTIQTILRDHQPIRIFRRQFTFNPKKFWQQALQNKLVPTGLQLCAINQALLERTETDMFPWESPQAFVEKGFGFWLMAGEEIISECSSAFIGKGAVEINVYTHEEYQRQGLATIVASALIEECLARGLRPNWECWWENEPSVALALKLGFEFAIDHAVYLTELP